MWRAQEAHAGIKHGQLGACFALKWKLHLPKVRFSREPIITNYQPSMPCNDVDLIDSVWGILARGCHK